MYQNVFIVGCFLISASQSFSPNKDLSEPKTFKLIQNIVRHNYERSLKRQHQSHVERNYPPMGHPRIPFKTPIRRTRHLKPSQRTQRKINNYQRKVQHGPSKSYSGKNIDRTFTVPKSTKNPPSSKEVRPTFLIKPAGPSQEFGWVGHGSYAPLGIPNIFKVAGIDTKWDPESNKVFETGLLYPVPTTKLVEEKPATIAKGQSFQQHSSHSNAHNSFIDNIIEEVSNDGQNPPPRFVKEISNQINPIFKDQQNQKNQNGKKATNETESNIILFDLPQKLRNGTLKNEILSPFTDDEIASDKNPFENFDISIEEIKELDWANQPENKMKQKVVHEVFKSPVSSLSLPAVATKLAKDIDENQKKLNNNKEFNDHESPIIDLSNLDIFSDFKVSSSKFFDEEEISLFDGNKRKRNPSILTSSSENKKEQLENNDFNENETSIIDLSNLDIFNDFDSSSLNGIKSKRNPSILSSSTDKINVDVDFTSSDHIHTFPPKVNSLPIGKTPQYTVVDYDQVDSIIKENRKDEFNIDLTDLFVESPLSTTTEPPEIRTIFVKPENAINIPEKYKKKIEATQQNYGKQEQKKNPIRIKQSSKLVKEGPSISFVEKEDSATKIKQKKLRKVGRGKKKKVVRNLQQPGLRDYGIPEPVRKIYTGPGKQGEKIRIKFGTRVQPKSVYNPLTI